METRNEQETKQHSGPIIEKDARKTKPYSKRIILFGILFLGAVILVVASQAKKNVGGDLTETEKAFQAPKGDFASMAAEFQARARKPQPLKTEVIERTPATQQGQVTLVTPIPPAQQQRYYSSEEDRQIAQQLRTMKIQAIMNPPKVDGFEELQDTKTSGATTQQQTQQRMLSQSPMPQGGGLSPEMVGQLMQQGGGDQNRQAQKLDFLKQGGSELTAQGYSEFLPEAQKFYLELKAGTVIPGMLVTGLNSDLPGPVVGQVTENIWDSTHGQFILIPKGTKILGVYDSQVTFGQKRVLVVWNRLIMPNGTSLNIAGSPGLDQSGYSGMKGKVDEHWGRMISTALLASLFITGAEIISPKENQTTFGGNNNAKSPGEIASEQAANMILEMSAKLMNKNMDIQPTITIRPGGRFNIFVQKDIVFPEPFPMEYR